MKESLKVYNHDASLASLTSSHTRYARIKGRVVVNRARQMIRGNESHESRNDAIMPEHLTMASQNAARSGSAIGDRERGRPVAVSTEKKKRKRRKEKESGSNTRERERTP